MKRTMMLPLAAFVCITTGLFADDDGGTRLGFMSLARVIEESAFGKEFKHTYESTMGEYRGKIQAEQQKMKVAIDNYERSQATLNDEAKKKKQAELERLQHDYERLAREGQEEIKRIETRLEKQVKVAAKDVANRKKLDAILDRDALRPPFVSENLDCTDSIIDILDKKFEEQEQERKKADAKKAPAAKKATAPAKK